MQARIGFVAEQLVVSVFGLEGRGDWVAATVESVLRRAEVHTTPPIVDGWSIARAEDALIGTIPEIGDVAPFDPRRHAIVSMVANALAVLNFEVLSLSGDALFG